MILSLARSLLRTRASLTLPLLALTRRAKNSHLILHSAEQIQNMISKRHTKLDPASEKPWKTNLQDELKQFRVSLVGLPNCGKSSLFNCLVGERVAIVDKHRGTTRDRKEFRILEGLASVIDTPGVEVELIRRSQGNKLKE
jgi:tRNA U34 5-carboxymethylaminomethyl modifying GTPase MnmE/TrmE